MSWSYGVRELLQALPEPSLVVTGKGEIVAANAGGRSLFGLDPDDVPGASLLERVSDPPGEVRTFLRACSATRSMVPGSLTLVADGQRPTPCRCEGAVVRPWTPEAEALVLLRARLDGSPGERFNLLNRKLEDLSKQIHERKRAEEALERSRALLEDSQKSARVGSWEWDVVRDTITWSDELYRIYGLEPGSELSLEGYLDLLPPSDRGRVRAAVERCLATGDAYSLQHALVRPDGTLRTVHARARVVTDGNGTAVALIGSEQDITERRRHDEGQELLAEAGGVFASRADGEAILRELATLTARWFGGFCAVYGLDEERHPRLIEAAHREPVRRELARRLLGSDPIAPTGVYRVIRSGEPELLSAESEIFLTAIARDADQIGLLREVGARSCLVVPLFARTRPLGAILLLATDRSLDGDDLALVEELARRAALVVENLRLYRESESRAEDEELLRRRAEEAAAVRDEVVAIVSHDLRNPLNTIGMATGLLEIDIPEEKKAAQIGIIQRAVRQMDHLIQDLLDVARMEAARFTIERERVDVAAVVEDACRLFEPQVNARQQGLDTAIAPGVPAIHADGRRLLQALSNLLANAIRHTPEGGRIAIRVEASAEEVVLSVADSGPGIPEDELPRLFDRFWQSRRSGRGGAGLGLSICKGIVEAHHGRIWVESTPGLGATFHLSVPLAQTDEESAGSPTAPASATRG